MRQAEPILNFENEMKAIFRIFLFALVIVFIIIGPYSQGHAELRSFIGGISILYWDDIKNHRGGTKYYFHIDKSTYYKLRIPNSEDEDLISNYTSNRCWGEESGALLKVQGYLVGNTLVVKSVKVVKNDL